MWFDAVIGYLSASIEWAEQRGTPDAWREWWQDADAEHTYFMGKDNIVFHTVILAEHVARVWKRWDVRCGSVYPELPDNVASSEFLTMEGKKFSSSRGVQILVRLPRRYDPDALRYFLATRPRNRTRTSRGPSSFGATTTSRSRRGATSVNRTLQSATRILGAVPTPGTLARLTTRHCSVRSGAGSTPSAVDRSRTLPKRATGGDAAGGASATNTSPSRRLGQAGLGPGAGRHDPLRRPPRR